MSFYLSVVLRLIGAVSKNYGISVQYGDQKKFSQFPPGVNASSIEFKIPRRRRG